MYSLDYSLFLPLSHRHRDRSVGPMIQKKIPLLETKTCPPYRSSELYLGHACVLTVLLHVCISFLLGYDYGNAWIQIACFQIPVFQIHTYTWLPLILKIN